MVYLEKAEAERTRPHNLMDDVGASFLPAQQFNKRKRAIRRGGGGKKKSRHNKALIQQQQSQNGGKKRKREATHPPVATPTPKASRLLELYGPSARASVELKLEEGGQIKTKDVQDLLLWCLGNGQNPKWIFVKNKPLIASAVVVVMRSVGKSLLEKYAKELTHLKGIKEGGVFQKGPFVAPGSKNRVFETMYALLTCPKPKSKRRRVESNPNAPPDSTNGQYLALNQARASPMYQFVLGQEELEVNCFPMQKYADQQRKAKEEAEAKLKQEQEEANKPKEETPIVIKKVDEESKEVDVSNYYSAIEEENEQLTLEDIAKQEEEEKIKQELESRSTPYNLKRSSALDYTHFKPLSGSQGPPLPFRRMLAVDCEMCVTKVGLELTRCTVVDERFEILYDSYVIPDNPILDYVTRYSGVTAALLEGVTNKLADVQKALQALFTEDTILVGHSVENDLLSLKMYHNQIIDTSLLYPHPNGPPSKQALRYLVQRHLKRNIQTASGGHDSAEDAKAAMELVQLKVVKGDNFGLYEEEGPSLFATLEESSKRKIAMIDRPISLEKYMPGSQATGVSCNTDEEIERQIITKLEPQNAPTTTTETANKASSASSETTEKADEASSSPSESTEEGSATIVPILPQFDLLWGQFHSIEDFYCRPSTSSAENSNNSEALKATDEEKGKEKVEEKEKEKEEEEEEEEGKTKEQKKETEQQTEKEEAVPEERELYRLLKEIDDRVGRIYTQAPPNTLLVFLSGRGSLQDVIGLQRRKTQGKWSTQDEKLLEEAVAATREGMGYFCVKQ